VKRLQVIFSSAGPSEPAHERRKNPRRMGLPRRIEDRRRGASAASEDSERRAVADRRSFGNRRRRPDRRIGLSPDLDLYLLGI